MKIIVVLVGLVGAIWLFMVFSGLYVESQIVQKDKEIAKLIQDNTKLQEKNKELTDTYAKVMEEFDSKALEIESIKQSINTTSGQLKGINNKLSQMGQKSQNKLSEIDKPLDNKTRCLRIVDELKEIGENVDPADYCKRY